MWTPRSNFEHRAEHSLFADTAMDFGEVRIQYILSFLFRFLIICHFRIVCQLNSFLMELLPMAYTLSLLVLMINRTRAIRQYVNTATKYKKIDGKIAATQFRGALFQIGFLPPGYAINTYWTNHTHFLCFLLTLSHLYFA